MLSRIQPVLAGGRKRLCHMVRRLRERRDAVRASPQYQFLKYRLTQYALLCRLHRRIGIYLVLWPTLWALWIAADGRPDILVFFVFAAGTVLMRSAGCAINDFADRNIDLYVRRTRDRPLAMGTIRAWEAILVFVVLSLMAFGLVLLMNRLTVKLAFVALVLAAFYPFSKRYTYMPQVVLGAAFRWAVPMAFAAQTGEIPIVAWLLYTATLLWTTAYDTMYAMVDRDDDLKIGVKSAAILFGEADVFLVMFLQGLALSALLMAGWQLQLSLFYYAGLGGALIVIVYQYVLIRHRERERCFKAFLSNHYLGMIVFLGLFAHYLWAIFGPTAS